MYHVCHSKQPCTQSTPLHTHTNTHTTPPPVHPSPHPSPHPSIHPQHPLPLYTLPLYTPHQALEMGYGGNPYGPAGTGKTESVKALATTLGRQVLVFNCDGEFDVQAMGRIFQGLVQCGAWGCFDEFNRLAEGVLSAVSQQIQVIQVGVVACGVWCMVYGVWCGCGCMMCGVWVVWVFLIRQNKTPTPNSIISWHYATSPPHWSLWAAQFQ